MPLVPLVLGALLAASLAANAYFVRASNRYFAQTNEVRLDPAGLKAYEAERALPAPSAEKPVLVLFGDSRALMWQKPELGEYEVRDLGVGNQTTAQVLLRFDADVPRLHPSVVVLEVGVNDLKTISEFPERRAAIVADCERNIARLVARSGEAGARVILVTIFGIGDVPLWKRPFWSSDVATAVDEVNEFLRGLASDRVVLFEADPTLEDPSGHIKPAYQLDYLHLTPAGYAALNERLVPLVHALPK